MSQLDRQAAYARAREHCGQLLTMISTSRATEKQQASMRNALELLWLQADHAAGGPECRP